MRAQRIPVPGHYHAAQLEKHAGTRDCSRVEVNFRVVQDCGSLWNGIRVLANAKILAGKNFPALRKNCELLNRLL
jgi:hypothetical protein